VSEDCEREMARIQSEVKGRLSAEYDARQKALLNPLSSTGGCSVTT